MIRFQITISIPITSHYPAALTNWTRSCDSNIKLKHVDGGKILGHIRVLLYNVM